MRFQPLTILMNIFLAAAVFFQAGCGEAGGRPAVAVVQASATATPVPATATLAPTSTPTLTPTRPTATPTLTPTVTPSPTPTWEAYSGILTSARQETVSRASINTVVPGDVLEKPIVWDLNLQNGCWKSDEAFTEPAFYADGMVKKIKQMDAPLLLTCGWKGVRSVRFTVRYPDGRENSKTFESGLEWGGGHTYTVAAPYQITLDDPPGVYTFIAENGSRRIEKQLTVEKTYYTKGPRVFPVFDDPFRANIHLLHPNRMLLYGFAPNEAVRLVLYNGLFNEQHSDIDMKYAFIGSQQVITGPDGNLVIKNEIREADYWIAIGETTGVVAESIYSGAGSLIPPGKFTWYCPAILPSRLSPIRDIRVVNTEGRGLRVRKQPGFNQEIVGELPEGTTFYPQTTPMCADRTWWWMVSTDHALGWVAEADPQEYVLEPLR